MKLFAAALFTLISAYSFAQAVVGRVLLAEPEVFLERAGVTLTPQEGGEIYALDNITTGAGGRIRILFIDNSSVSLGEDSEFSVQEVVEKGKNSAFNAKLGKGMARFVTGRIVEMNPAGFAVKTPDSTAGIRGTTFAIGIAKGVSTMYVLSASKSKDVLFNGVHVPAGNKLLSTSVLPVSLTQSDYDMIESSTSPKPKKEKPKPESPKAPDNATPSDNASLEELKTEYIRDVDAFYDNESKLMVDDKQRPITGLVITKDNLTRIEADYARGKREGAQKLFVEDILRIELTFLNDVGHGIKKSYGADGKLASEEPYINGVRQGVASYYKNGALTFERPFEKDSLEGWGFEYKGKKKAKRIFYEKGRVKAGNCMNGEAVGRTFRVSEVQSLNDGLTFECYN